MTIVGPRGGRVPVWLLALAVASACSPAPSPMPGPPPPPPETYRTTVRVVSALTPDVGVPSVTVNVAGLAPLQTDASGAAVIELTTPSTVSLRLNHAAFVERETRARVPDTATVTISLIPSSIDLETLEEFSPRTSGLRRWLRSPRLVVVTHAIDFAGATPDFLEYPVTDREIASDQLDCLASGIGASLSLMSGGALAWESVEIQPIQPGSRVRTDTTPIGTILVMPSISLGTGGRGTAYTGSDGPFTLTRGAIWVTANLNYCLTSPGLFRHELGHALGYMHVTRILSVMSANFTPDPTEFDLNAIAIVFQRPPGNRTPDRDPADGSLNVTASGWPMPFAASRRAVSRAAQVRHPVTPTALERPPPVGR